MDADGDHDDGYDVLDLQFFMQQKGCEDHAQDRDQGVVDRDLADRMVGEQRIVDREADRGNSDKAEKDEDTLCREDPCRLRAYKCCGQDEQRTADLHTVSGRPCDVHPAGDDPGDQTAESRAAGIEQDHTVAHKSDILKEIHAGLDIDGDNAGDAKNAADRFPPCHLIIRKNDCRQDDQDKSSHRIEYGRSGTAVVTKSDVGEHIMKRCINDAQEHQPGNIALIGDVGFYLFFLLVQRHCSSCHKKAHTCEQDLAAQIPAVNLKLLIAQFDQRIGQGPPDHDKNGKKYFESIVL